MTRNEILTVGLLVGLVGALSAWAVADARSRARDIARLAHVRELQLGLEFYYSDRATYPEAKEILPLGQANSACLGEDGFTGPCASGGPRPYLERVPVPPPNGVDVRAYQYQATADQYRLTFALEGRSAALGLAKGLNCATEQGLRAGACDSLTD
jgi:hypothetical protein